MGSHLQSFCMSTMILLIVFSATLAICQPTSASSFEQNTPNISQIFEGWMTKHDRVYSNSEEKARRFGIFKAKYQYHQNFNKEGGKKLYTLGLNQFSDMTRKEFQSNKCRRTTVATGAGIKIFNSSSLDGEINTCNVNVDWSKDIWSENGAVSAVSPVRDQGSHCGACWAMASVAAVEAGIRIIWGYDIPLPPLSIQQVLDCAYGDRCEGGSEIDAYVYIMKNMGLASEKGYPYTEKNGTCDENREDDVVEDSSIDGLVVVRPQTENELRRALCRRPVTAGIAANSLEFEQYDGGIFNGPCGQDIDHTVLVVGFGSDENGVEYWKIQNFWGESWGEQGYMRLALEAEGKCQIAMEASFPLVE